MLKKYVIWLLGYRRIINSINFNVYRNVKFSPFKIDAVLYNIFIIKFFSRAFCIRKNGFIFPIYKIIWLNSRKFPGLIANSKILKIILLPWERNSKNPVANNGWRCCIITDKGQIYHNFPNRKRTPEFYDGIERKGDIDRWDESVVWDMPNRRYPSKKSNDFPYVYNPFLPDDVYAFHPSLNNDNGYGHDGYNAYCKKNIAGEAKYFPRFYIHKRCAKNNPFFFMSGFEISNKLHLLGSYGSNVNEETATRICLFATSDGGRQWFNKCEFASNEYQLALGNPLKLNKIFERYYPQSLIAIRRFYNYPSCENKEPENLFVFDNAIAINKITNTNDDFLELTTQEAHNFITGDIIIIKQNTDSEHIPLIWRSLCNNESSEYSGGNGIIWRVKVTSQCSFILYEYIHNPCTNITVRHIHSINKIKDGFVIGTGDLYPQGWIYFFQVKNSDTFDPVNAWENFDIIRLNSSAKGIQRTLGTILLDDKNQSVLFASDEAYIHRPNVKMPLGRTSNFSRSSTGIFRGYLNDIDDISLFECIFESDQPAYFFKEKSNMLIFAGQQNEIAISIDKGNNWLKFNLMPIHFHYLLNNTTYSKSLAMQYFKGTDSRGWVYLDDLIIIRK